jgi:hypothetical protein
MRLLRVPQRLHGLPRARFAATGNYLDEEPFCVYEPPKA